MILPGNAFDFKPASIKKKIFSLSFVLILLNILTFISLSQSNHDKEIRSLLSQITQTSHLRQMQSMYIQSQDEIEKEKAQSKLFEDPYAFLKDRLFWEKAQKDIYHGDEILIQSNRALLKQLSQVYSKSNQEVYGIGQTAQTPWNWITYQFTHANLFHLLNNIVFLFLIVALLEKTISLGWIISVYLLSGVGAGVFYLFISEGMSLPVVGASGSIAGLMTFLCVTRGKQNIEWSYFFGPLKGLYGLIYMPAFFIIPFYLLSDLTAILNSSSGVSQSVAHSAHIGGALTGLILSGLYLFERYVFFEFYNLKSKF